MFAIIAHLVPLLLVIEKALLSLLFFLGFATIVIFVWRWRSYSLAQGKPGRWMSALSENIRAAQPSGVALDKADEATVAGRVVKTGLANLGLAPEALEKVFDVQESGERRELNRGLPFLGTVGSNAPFLGLTGTVIGILSAFDRFAASGGRGSTEVMVAISRALVATAIGLLVAIPAVVFYNILRSRSKSILEQAREIRGLIMARSLQATFRKPEA
ncbi:MAG: MotA/TolQ/ExbB proton channel [Fibrobacteres bacterium]|nr:MotA/TolQ/ExbB proton channel [Fibrobacterota bacterium]